MPPSSSSSSPSAEGKPSYWTNHHHDNTQDQPRRDQGPRLGDDVRAEPASQGGGELPTHRGETDMWDSNKTLLM